MLGIFGTFCLQNTLHRTDPGNAFSVKKIRKALSLDSGQPSLAPPDPPLLSATVAEESMANRPSVLFRTLLTMYIKKSLMNPLKRAYLPLSPEGALFRSISIPLLLTLCILLYTPGDVGTLE